MLGKAWNILRAQALHSIIVTTHIISIFLCENYKYANPFRRCLLLVLVLRPDMSWTSCQRCSGCERLSLKQTVYSGASSHEEKIKDLSLPLSYPVTLDTLSSEPHFPHL